MTFLSRTQTKIVLLVAVLAAVGAVCAHVAFARSSSKLGTGVVIIETNLKYEGGSAAGTGMVLTSNGEVLTNNHVISGATTIRVRVPGAGRTYTAKVVGYSRSKDVAVLQLQNASNLKTISVSGPSAKIGQTVTAVGDAGGAGVLSTVHGSVTALRQTITASDETEASETLTGLIETNADVVPGDSGGPLLDASGNVIGMDTAASSGSPYQVAESTEGYAIPIHTALALASAIEAGKSSTIVHVGATAFLGVEVTEVQTWNGTATEIEGVVTGGPADRAGLGAGDVITALDGKSISAATDVTSFVLAQKPGTKVSVSYTDAYGDPGVATVTLGTGPAQ